MSHNTAATVAHTIGIDTGKNTLHLIGLDDKSAIVLRENSPRHSASCPSSAFASLRSGVSKPSVNQP